MGGRLRHSSLADLFKHPTVIPKEHHVTTLIIAHNHEKTKHQGKGFTMNEIRSSGYWIPGMSRAVASYIHQCVTCRRLRRPPEGQRMNDLPVEWSRALPALHILRYGLLWSFCYCGGKETAQTKWSDHCLLLLMGHPHWNVRGHDQGCLHQQPVMLHCYQMKSSTALPPPGTFPKEDLYGAKTWRCMQFLAQQF